MKTASRHIKKIFCTLTRWLLSSPLVKSVAEPASVITAQVGSHISTIFVDCWGCLACLASVEKRLLCAGGVLPRVDMETLYLWIRTHKPEAVLELGPRCGYSTFWILQALEDNEKGLLYSFDSTSQLKASRCIVVRFIVSMLGSDRRLLSARLTAPW